MSRLYIDQLNFLFSQINPLKIGILFELVHDYRFLLILGVIIVFVKE